MRAFLIEYGVEGADKGTLSETIEAIDRDAVMHRIHTNLEKHSFIVEFGPDTWAVVVSSKVFYVHVSELPELKDLPEERRSLPTR